MSKKTANLETELLFFFLKTVFQTLLQQVGWQLTKWLKNSVAWIWGTDSVYSFQENRKHLVQVVRIMAEMFKQETWGVGQVSILIKKSTTGVMDLVAA